MNSFGVKGAVCTALVVIALLSIGCSSSPLARPAVIGASVSGGTAATRPVGGRNDRLATIDMATALDAWIVAPHEVTKSFADEATFIGPVDSISSQVAQARQVGATVVVAVDALFWPLYAPAKDDDERIKRLDAALEALATLRVPLVVGDVPDMSAAVGTMLRADQVPSPALLASSGERIRSWASERPNVVVMPMAELAQAAQRGTELTVRGERLSGADAAKLIASDRLHASADGVIAIAGAALDALIAARAIDASDVRDSTSAARAALVVRRTQRPAETVDELKARLDAQLADGDDYVEFLKLKNRDDTRAIERGLALIARTPALRAMTFEAEVTSEMVQRWPDQRATLIEVMRAAQQSTLTADRTLADYTTWSLVAVGLRDDSAMRASAQAWHVLLRAVGDDTYDGDGTTYDVASRVYRALARVDATAAGLFWPDPIRLAQTWQKEAEADEAFRRRANAFAPDLKLPKTDMPREQAAALEQQLRSANRAIEADALHAQLSQLKQDQ